MNPSDLFQKHIDIMQSRIGEILVDYKLQGLIISAGELSYYQDDDMAMPFRSLHHFRHWCPLEGPTHLLLIRLGHKPKLFHHTPLDFWHDHQNIDNEFWLDSFVIEDHPTLKSMWESLGPLSNVGYLGNANEFSEKLSLTQVDAEMINRMNWHRTYKTDWEYHCLREATQLGVRGHVAAKKSFLEGSSELEVYYSFLKGTGQTENQLPYTPIVGINEKAAILHYSQKRSCVVNSKVLLIDAGASYSGYGSDITRTWFVEHTPQEFKDLTLAMNDLQLSLCNSALPGMSFCELHDQCNLGIAKILVDSGIVKGIDASEVLEKGLVNYFFPHGLGHMLGIFTHDVAGKQKDPVGAKVDIDEEHTVLRNHRTIEPGFVLTVEPGLYFISILLEQAKHSSHSQFMNWNLIDFLTPCGGIRIEDNIYVRAEKAENLTREYLP